ncbi:MAG: hypothetical protein ABIH41_07365 [Nanoarchaeota archaeon]
MSQVHILNSKERKHILRGINERFGCEFTTDKAMLINNKDRIYIIDTALDRVPAETLRIDSIGMYFGTMENDEMRPSIEGSQLIGPQATKHIIDIDDVEIEHWVTGQDIHIPAEEARAIEHGLNLIRHKGDFFGCAKTQVGDGAKLINHVPKIRRMKTINRP